MIKATKSFSQKHSNKTFYIIIFRSISN